MIKKMTYEESQKYLEKRRATIEKIIALLHDENFNVAQAQGVLRDVGDEILSHSYF